MKISGKLIKDDMGSGGWVLKTPDGKKVSLYGDINEAWANKAVTVEGEEGSGFGMAGTTSLRINSIKKA